MKDLLIIIQSDPYASATVAEAIDMAYAAAAFDVEVTLLFRGPGTLCLMSEQQNQLLGMKSIEKKVAALPLYGVEQLLAVTEDAARWPLPPSEIVNFVPQNQLPELMAHFQAIQVY